MNEEPQGTRPYEVIAYGSLGVVFLIQVVEGNLLGGMLAFGCGVLAMIGKLQMGPIFYLVLLAGNLLAHHNQGIERRNTFRPAWLDINDIVTCIGVIAFVAVHYRLQGIWFHNLARDPRRRRGLRSFHLSLGRLFEAPDPRRRSPQQVTRSEVSWLMLTLPAWALCAQFFTYGIARIRVPHVDLWLIRILAGVWILGIGTFVVMNLLDIWKRYTMHPTAARMFLQDTLWRETRGEQRQLQRWLAWKRMRKVPR